MGYIFPNTLKHGHNIHSMRIGFDHLPNKTWVASLKKSPSKPYIYALPISICIQKGSKIFNEGEAAIEDLHFP